MTPNAALRTYQQEAVDRLVKEKRFLLYDQQGLGKTPETLVAINELEAWRVLVHCPKRAIGVWRHEAAIWLPDHRIVEYTGKPAERELAWKKLYEDVPIIVICNWVFAEELRKRMEQESPNSTWNVVVADEIHSAGLLNRTSNTFKTFERIRTQSMFLLTGSPTPRGCVDYWPPLHILHPQEFKSFWKFVNQWAIVERTEFGTNIRRHPRDIEKFKQEIVHRYSLRRFKSDVLHDLPPKQRQVVRLEMTPKQAKAYKELATEMMTYADENNIILTPNVLARDQRLRQLLVCPRLLGIDDNGAAMDALHSTVCEESNPFAVFTPFRGAAEYIAGLLHKVVGSENVYLITGGMSEDELDYQVRSFQNSPRDTRAIVATIASATSWTAHAASNGYFVGFEWSHDANEQAEDRLHRFGQHDPCNFWYFAHSGTIEDRVEELVDDKYISHNIVFDRKEFLHGSK